MDQPSTANSDLETGGAESQQPAMTPARTSRRLKVKRDSGQPPYKNSKHRDTESDTSNNRVRGMQRASAERKDGKQSKKNAAKEVIEVPVKQEPVLDDEQSPSPRRARKQKVPKRFTDDDEEEITKQKPPKRPKKLKTSEEEETKGQSDEDWVPADKKPAKKVSRGGSGKQQSKSSTAISFPCSECDKVLSSPTELKMHKKVKHRQNFKCKHCGIQYQGRYSLTKHELIKHGAGHLATRPTFKCKHCHHMFVKEYFHKKHEAICKGPHKCKHCEKVFSNLMLKKKHQASSCLVKMRSICSKCGKAVDRRTFNSHMAEHAGIFLYSCSICKHGFKRKISLRRHEQLHAQTGKADLERLYECKICKKLCKSQLFLDFHVKRHEKGQEPYQCDKCEASFFYANKFFEHLRSHDGKESHKCSKCNKSYKNKRNLDRHVKTHTREDAAQCPTCYKIFSTAGNLKVHMRLHDKSVQFTCHVCGKVFVQKSHLQYHEQSHDKDRILYECSHCDKKYTTSYYRDLHVRMKHTKKDLPKCQHCDLLCQNEKQLKKHLLAKCAPDSAVDNDYVFCKQCGLKLENVLELDNHITNEHKLNDFSCKLCEYKGTKQSALVVHMRRHTNERPYQCKECLRAFKQRTTLINHMRLHTGEKPYKCDVCDKSFIQKYNLTCHIRVHTGDRPWICKHCGKGFIQQTNYKSHEDRCGKGLIKLPKPPREKKTKPPPREPLKIPTPPQPSAAVGQGDPWTAQKLATAVGQTQKKIIYEHPEALPKNLIKIQEDEEHQQIVTIIVENMNTDVQGSVISQSAVEAALRAAGTGTSHGSEMVTVVRPDSPQQYLSSRSGEMHPQQAAELVVAAALANVNRYTQQPPDQLAVADSSSVLQQVIHSATENVVETTAGEASVSHIHQTVREDSNVVPVGIASQQVVREVHSEPGEQIQHVLVHEPADQTQEHQVFHVVSGESADQGDVDINTATGVLSAILNG